jgi:hypothetical protein
MAKNKIKISKVRSNLYAVGRLLGDVNAIQNKRIMKRLGNRVVGRITGKVIGKLTSGFFKRK